MQKKYSVILVIVCVFIALTHWQWPSEKASKQANIGKVGIDWQSCWFEHNDPTLQVKCGWMERPGANHNYRIPVVIIEPNVQKTNKEVNKEPPSQTLPLLYLGGGPGAGLSLNSEGIQHWLGWYQRYQLNQPLVLAEYRSTGLSKPQFSCPPYYNAYKSSIIDYQTVTANELHRTLKQCFDIWQDRGFAVADFSAAAIAADFKAITTSLGYKNYDIYAVSYGTKIALELANLDKNHVHQLILDSAVNDTWVGANGWPKRLAAGLMQYFDYCKAEPICAITKNNLLAQLQQLAHQPQSIIVSQKKTSIPIKVNDQVFLSALLSSLPAIINQPAQSSERLEFGFKTIKATAIQSEQILADQHLKQLIQHFIINTLSDDFSFLTYFASSCSDNLGFDANNYKHWVNELNTHAYLLPYIGYNAEIDICNALIEQPTTKPTLAPLDKNVLVLSGGIDATTPLKGATELTQQIMGSSTSNIHLAVFPHVGHGVSESSICAQNLVAQFLHHSSIDLNTAAHCQAEQVYIHEF